MRFIRGKAKGIVDDVLPILMYVLIAGVLLLTFINMNAAINRKVSLNQISRKYMLTMETKGMLDSQDIADLKSELARNGFYASSGSDMSQVEALNNFVVVDTAGGHGFAGHQDGQNIYATCTNVGYGNPIELTIDVYCETRLGVGDGFNLMSPRFKKTLSPITVRLLSTAKN